MKTFIAFLLTLAWMAGVAQTRNVSGYVQMADGRPIKGATVEARLFDGLNYPAYYAMANTKGYYQLIGLPEGTYEITAVNNTAQNEWIRPDSADVDLAYRIWKRLTRIPWTWELMASMNSRYDQYLQNFVGDSLDYAFVKSLAEGRDPPTAWRFEKQRIYIEGQNITGLPILGQMPGNFDNAASLKKK